MGSRKVDNHYRVSSRCAVHAPWSSGVARHRLGFVTGHFSILFCRLGLCSWASSHQSAFRKSVDPPFLATQSVQFSATSSIFPPWRMRVLGVRLGGFGSSGHLASSVLCRGLSACSHSCRFSLGHQNCHIGVWCQNRTSRLTSRSRRTATPPLNSSVRPTNESKGNSAVRPVW